jgi:hypothetical protein
MRSNPNPPTRTIAGVVTSGGAVQQGAGFSVIKNATGNFTVRFTPAFLAPPVITVTTLGAAVSYVAFWATDYFIVQTYVSTSGAGTDATFSFVAIGRP